MEQNVFVVADNIDWEKSGDGIRRKILAYDKELMLVRVEFKKDSVGSIHRHHHSQITNIESGCFEVVIANERKVLKTGDAFYIPPNVEHGCVCLEDGVLIDVFSPMREDFLIA